MGMGIGMAFTFWSFLFQICCATRTFTVRIILVLTTRPCINRSTGAEIDGLCSFVRFSMEYPSCGCE